MEAQRKLLDWHGQLRVKMLGREFYCRRTRRAVSGHLGQELSARMMRRSDFRDDAYRTDAHGKHTATDRPCLASVACGPSPPDVYGSKADAIGGGAAEVRLTAAPCQQLRYGLTEGGTAAIDAPDPELQYYSSLSVCLSLSASDGSNRILCWPSLRGSGVSSEPA